MKKKILAVALTCVIASGSIAGFCACGVRIEKGEQVSKSGWASAFEKAAEAENYTLQTEGHYEAKYDGSISVSSDKVSEIKVDTSVTRSTAINVWYSKDKDTAYSERVYHDNKTDINNKGTSAEESVTSKENSTRKEYYEFRKNENDDKTFWCASYGKKDVKNSELNYSEESYWSAGSTNFFKSSSIDLGITLYDSADKETANLINLAEAYDKFTYANGEYTADLFVGQYLDFGSSWSGTYGITVYVPCTVTVSIKGGNVIGLAAKFEGDGSGTANDGYSIPHYNYDVKGNFALAVSNIGSTDASKKRSKEIGKAIEKQKAIEKLNENN